MSETDPIPENDPERPSPPEHSPPKLSPRNNPFKAQDPGAKTLRGVTPEGAVQLPRLPRSPGHAPLTQPPEAIELPRRSRTVPSAAPDYPVLEAIKLQDFVPIYRRPEFRSVCALVAVVALAVTGSITFLRRQKLRNAELAAERALPLPTPEEVAEETIDGSELSGPIPGQETLQQLATAAELGNLQTYEALANQALTTPAAQDVRFLAQLVRAYRAFLLELDIASNQRLALLQPMVTALLSAAAEDPAKLEVAGSCLLELGFTNEASDVLQKAADAAPNRLSTLRQLAFALLAQGERRRAVDVLRQLAQARPGNISARLALAALYEQIDDAGSAISAYEAALRVDPGNRDALDRKLLLLRTSGRIDEALEASAAAIAQFGETPEVLVRRGEALMAASRFSDARATLERARDITPDISTLGPGFYSNLAISCMQVGALVDAERYFRKVIELDPTDDHMAKNNLAFLLLQDRRNLPEALTLARSAADHSPNNPHYADTYGLALLLTGPAERARDQFNRAIKFAPSPKPDYHEHLGDAENALGNGEAAAAAWARALSLDSSRTHLKSRIQPAPTPRK